MGYVEVKAGNVRVEGSAGAPHGLVRDPGDGYDGTNEVLACDIAYHDFSKYSC